MTGDDIKVRVMVDSFLVLGSDEPCSNAPVYLLGNV
jgi:hypothetical protein